MNSLINIYSLHSAFLPQAIKWLVYVTQISLRMVIVDQAALPKIAIVDQPCFILMVLQGNYTYFWGPIKEFYKDFFSIDLGKILQNCGKWLLLCYNSNFFA